MKRLIVYICVCLLMLTTLTACQQPAEEPQKPSHTPEVAPPALKVELKNLITPEEIGDAIGCEVGEPQMWEDDTWAHYTGVDEATTLDISMDEVSRDVFDGRLMNYTDLVEVPHLGEVSYYSPLSGEVLTYESEIMFSVQVRYADESDQETVLMAARHLTALLLDGALGK